MTENTETALEATEMSTVEDQVSDDAPTAAAVHVLGPDSILTAVDLSDAMRKAHEINSTLVASLPLSPFDPHTWAVPVPEGHFAYPLRPGETVPGGAYQPRPRRVPTSAGDCEAVWKGDWGTVFVNTVLDEDGDPGQVLFFDIEQGSEENGMDPEISAELAEVIAAATDAAAGKALGWRQYRAESPLNGEPDPEHAGMVNTGNGTWEGPTRLAPTFRAPDVVDFARQYLDLGRVVTVYTRVFRTFTDVTEWEPRVYGVPQLGNPAL
ncbi:hypothetical protein BKG82_26305 [Mycobacteroides chelonae]|uniref:Uncharacterized protein n=1 Tax=Mycobacteroides chelonae TaxID=1774 RepID=A0A1S1LIK2_MYCCH|nr:hypothetical protein [Mycobacteroides chelonae]OHU47172.1 hypothetical protein BKG82_26305 [Mycobacteroides chelonae]